MKKLLIKSSLFSVLAFLNFACQPNQSILNSSINSAGTGGATPAERPKDTFESALRGVQRSGFKYIFVIRRKDGEQFNKEDKAYIRANSPSATNQFVLTDEQRTIIAGSNYPFPADSLEILRKVFSVEDLSPPPPPPGDNSNGAAENTSAENTSTANTPADDNSVQSNSAQNNSNNVNGDLKK